MDFFCKLLGCRLVKPTAVVAWLPVPRQHGSNINVSNRNPPERAAHVIHFNFPPPKKRFFASFYCLIIFVAEKIDPRD